MATMNPTHLQIMDNVDEETAVLMIQLQLDDAECMFTNSKGKYREGEVSDAELALQLYRQELDISALILSDRRMTQSIANAVQTDGQILTETSTQEQIATKDHDMAQTWTGEAFVSDIAAPTRFVDNGLDDELLAKLQALYVSDVYDLQSLPFRSDEDGQEAGVAESSSWASGRAENSRSIIRRCESCREDKKFFDVARVPCNHEYCRDCLNNLFRLSLTDESLFPPRCCRKPIPVESVRLFLKSKLVQDYETKKVEFETLDRTYCCSQLCSAFVRVEDINGEVATCRECGTTTCTMCKAATHRGDCPSDLALQQVLKAATESGWQRCHSCWRIVELDTGCNHITCRCGAQFCYVCGVKWKECECDQWDEHHLLARANQIVDRDMALPEDMPAIDRPVGDLQAANIEREVIPFEDPTGPVQAVVPRPRDILVAQTMRNLLANHACDHDRWRWVPGSHRCEECHHFLLEYIFECRQCQLQACNRCRRHRL